MDRAQETDPSCHWGYRKSKDANAAFLLCVSLFYSQQLSVLPHPLYPQHPPVDSRVPGALCCGTMLLSVAVLVPFPSCSHTLGTLAKRRHRFIQPCAPGRRWELAAS